MLPVIHSLALTAALAPSVLLTATSTEGLAPAEPLSPRQVAERHGPAVVLVTAELGERQTRQGSGFLVDPTGVVATSLHVIEGARRVVVHTADRSEHELLGIQAYDARNDLVLLRIGEQALTAPPLGDSTALAVGDPVVVIGNPLGLTHSVSTGILSARRRPDDATDESGPRRIVELPDCELLQLSAPAAPGSSGAPVFDAAGAVVGVQVGAIWSGALDLNFAIPIEALTPLLDRAEGLHLESLLERLDAERRDRAELHFDNARFACQQQDHETCEVELERALRLHPRYVEALTLRSRLLAEQQELGRAKEVLLEAREVLADSAAIWYALGELGLRAADSLTPRVRAEARECFREADRLEPGHPGAAAGLGLLLLVESRYEEAIEQLEVAARADPELLDCGVRLGEAYLASRRFEEAEEAFQNVLWANSGNARAHMGLGVVYSLTGQSFDERHHWALFFELAEEDPALAPLTRQALEFLRLRRPDLIPDRYE